MADFLTAVKSVRTQDQRSTQDSGLLEVKSSIKVKDDRHDKSTTVDGKGQETSRTNLAVRRKTLASPQDVLHVIRSQPDLDQLVPALHTLHSHAFGPDFNIHAPGPLQSQIINVLINNIIPDFWPTLEVEHGRDMVSCLRNVAGFNAVIARLKLFNTEKATNAQKDGLNIQEIEDLLRVVELMFKGNHAVVKVLHNLQNAVAAEVRQEMAWKEFVNLIGSGKVISTLAEAFDRVNASKGTTKALNTVPGMTSGSEYAAWLGRNIANMLLADPGRNDDQNSQPAASLLSKALNLGYSNSLLLGFFRQVLPDLVSERLPKRRLQELLRNLPPSTARSFLEHLLRWLSNMSSFDATRRQINDDEVRKNIRGLAALIHLVATTDRREFEMMLHLLSDPSYSSTLSLPVRRACLATIASSANAADDLQGLLDTCMTTFNDAIFANHAPILQQESLAQMLLIVSGYIHRWGPMALLMMARSSNHMQGVSNRLDSSNARARWLGMIVATAISSLVDKEGARMDFGTDDMQTREARWYLQLVSVGDAVGTLEEFRGILQYESHLTRTRKRNMREVEPKEMPKLDGKPMFGPLRPPVQTEVIGEKVTELLDSGEETDDEDLKPYAKPDSDPEDSDEDATLVNRNKPKPPVYIRDLMAMLRDDKNHDRFQLAIKHAASLIRRKSNFGAEVKDHAEEIGVILCNLQDLFKTDDFDELKLQAMIAVLLSDVQTMAPWFSKQAFLGDYSIAQRCAILSALGLGGRELAGLKNEDDLNPAISNTTFPSKRLLSHLHSIYAIEETPIKRLDAASKDIEQALIKPLALQAADQSTAHLNAVKVRTFSSRMDVERTKRKPAANALAKVFGEAFFFPLANRYQQEIAAYSTSSVYSSVPFLLVTFVKTLALLLHASGPATTGIFEISSEFWDLLLSLRVTAMSDISILQAVLFSLLTLLEVNTDKQRIVQQHPKQLMETQQWVEMVFERMGGGDSTSDNADEAKVQTLAAGVLAKTREVIEAYQKELVGFGV